MVKCEWFHCQHEHKDMLITDSVKLGNNYYHKDCAEEKRSIDKAVKCWKTYVDDSVSVGNLKDVLHTLVFKRNVSVEFLYYTIRECGLNGWLHRPNGLYYAVEDKNLYHDWQKTLTARIKAQNDKITGNMILSNEGIQNSENFKKHETVLASKKKNFERLFV